MKFSTKDKDQDAYSSSCAQKFTGAFWYNSCYLANLNGQYLNGQSDKGMVWEEFRGKDSLKTSQIKFRPDYIKI